jgi:hypothetical protein
VEAMKPRYGLCLVLIGAGREFAAETIPGNIRTIAAGFDQAMLQPALDALVV